MVIPAIVPIAAIGGAVLAIGGYLKNRKKGEKFSWCKMIGSILVGAAGGAAQFIPGVGPIVGSALVGAGAMALGKKAVNVVSAKKLPEN